jgi:ABC-type dipeptide/oligopeptide/nickel transport system permease subunit
MSTVAPDIVDDRTQAAEEAMDHRETIWGKAVYKLRRDRLGMIGLGVVMFYFIVAVGVWLGLWATEWGDVEGPKWAPMSSEYWFGTNIIGQDIFQRAVYSTKTAFEVGLVVAVLSTIIGAILGALAGFFSGTWIDGIILWLKGVAMVSTFWTTTGRLVRGEVIKLKNFEFVEAARAIGVPQVTIIFRHILPNTFHILLVQATIVFVAAIKSEVILSFLGLGVQDGVSWGLMISESTQEVLAGFFNNFLWASVFLFGLVMAFNMFSDALQDALDPRKVASE